MNMKKWTALVLLLIPALVLASGGHAEEGRYFAQTGRENDFIPRVVNFIIFASLLYYLAANPIKNFFKERKEGIAAQLQEIEEKLQSAKHEEREAQVRLEESQKKADQIIADAKKEAKLLAEKNKPQADVVMGLALTSLLVMDQENLLHPYRPKNIEALKPNFYSQKTIPTWTGMTAWESALCVNTVELKKRNLPVPQSWQDLTKAQYKDLIVMPNPASSGTGYLDVTAWIQIFGEQKAWPYMKDLDRNISQYVHSGSKPCKMAAQGEAVIGISFGYPGLKLQAQGAPLELVYPKEGLGWEMEASAIVKGTKHLSSAQKFIDWTVSEEANELYAQNFGLVAHQKVKPQHKGMPVDLEEKLIPHNFDWAAQQRDSILKRWSAQFEH